MWKASCAAPETSNSSTKRMHGLWALARSNSRFTLMKLSPRNCPLHSEIVAATRGRPHSLASAWAMAVLPVPGGPYNRMRSGIATPCAVSTSQFRSLLRRFASWSTSVSGRTRPSQLTFSPRCGAGAISVMVFSSSCQCCRHASDQGTSLQFYARAEVEKNGSRQSTQASDQSRGWDCTIGCMDVARAFRPGGLL